jgi:EAL domain-containing protein (putative c-di-GMP-specific phosphodiesterase class I)
MSVRQLRNDDCVDELRQLMEETGCKAEWLELEITEEEIMTDTNKAIMVLNQIRDLGIKLAIDDFGTGYSSLSQLKRLPLNKLKIDRSFIRDLPDDDEDRAISKTIIALAHNMGLNVVAEGVETESQKDFLLKNGCNLVQGYLYSKPVVASEFESKLVQQTK